MLNLRLKKQATKGEGGQLEGRGQVRKEGEWIWLKYIAYVYISNILKTMILEK